MTLNFTDTQPCETIRE